MKPIFSLCAGLLLACHCAAQPAFDYSKIFGGNQLTVPLATALDAYDNIYLTGYTYATDLASPGGFQTNFMGLQDTFVAELDTNGTLVFCTYLTGSDSQSMQSGQGIIVDINGNILVTGYTSSTNFPTLNPFQSTNAGGYDAFVTVLAPGGSALVYSTYFGGSGLDAGTSIVLDTNDNFIVGGYTQSANLPTANAMQPTNGGNGDAFVTKFATNGSSLVYSTYLGGTDSEDSGSDALISYAPTALADLGGALTVDFGGNAYITGWTYSTNFPVKNAFQPTNPTVSPYFTAAFVTKLDPSGQLVYSTYFGGMLGDFSRAIGVDYSNNVYFAGNSVNGDLPITNAFQPNFGGTAGNEGDGFIAAFDPTGTNLIYCTYLGGSGEDQINALAVQLDGSVAVTGSTTSPNFPLLNATQSNSWNGLLASSNTGSLWNMTGIGLTSTKISSIAMDPFNSATLYAITSVSLCKSTNRGQTWTSINPTFPGFCTYSAEQLLALDPVHPGTIYYASFSGVLKTADGGATWTTLNTGLPSTPQIQAITVDSQSPNNVYLGTYSAGVFKSTNAGTNWSAMNTGLSHLQVSAIWVDPLNSSNVFVGLGTPFSASVFQSTNGALNWIAVTGLPTYDAPVALMAGIHLPGATTSYLYVVLGDFFEDATLYGTTNNGASWFIPLEMLGGDIESLALAPPPRPNLEIGKGATNLSLFWTAAFTNYALQTTPSLAPSEWQNVGTSPGLIGNNSVVSLPLSPTQVYYRLSYTNTVLPPPYIYVGGDQTSLQGVLTSTDDGNTWSAIGLEGDFVYAMAVDKESPNNVYAGLSSGVDGFITTLTPSGQLYSSTYLGGNGFDEGLAIAFDDGNAYAIGFSDSPDFPIIAAANSSAKPLEGPKPPAATSPTGKGAKPGIATVVKQSEVADCPPPPENITLNCKVSALFAFGVPGNSKNDPYATGTLPSGITAINASWYNLTILKGNPTQRGVFMITYTYPGKCGRVINITINVN